jgi:leucyl aminopeptidase
MHVTVDARALAEADADLVALPLTSLAGEAPRLPSRAAALDRALDGKLRAVIERGDFRGRRGESLLLYSEGAIPAPRVLLLGLGDEGSLDADALRVAAGSAVSEAAARHAAKLALGVPATRRLRPPAAAQALAEGALLGGYRFDAYKEPPEEAPGRVEAVALSLERAPDVRAARSAARTGQVLAESQNVARDLSNQPPNELPPAALAREAQRVGREAGLRVRVLNVAELRRQKMGAILAVGGGSAHTPRLVVMEHNAPGRGRQRRRRLPTVCLVGKGITFDSGGISIKPSPAMDEMKHDMSGAAAVVGAMRACGLLKLPLHVVGVIGAAENLPSGTAYRPGDIVTSRSGKTIEVLNTDAEGRVVLSDALDYARSEFEPQAIVDLATLTGACVVALGSWATGLFGNHERLVERVRRAGETTAERAWPMPVWEEHRKSVRSEVADLKNAAGRDAGASTAAAFLAAFVGDTPWVHLDIAGTAWTGKPAGYQPRGATGVGVRLLLEVLRDWRSFKLDGRGGRD